MCGGAIISDADAVFNRERKLSADDLWSEFDTSDLFGWDFKPQTLLSTTEVAIKNKTISKHKKIFNEGISSTMFKHIHTVMKL